MASWIDHYMLFTSNSHKAYRRAIARPLLIQSPSLWSHYGALALAYTSPEFQKRAV